MGILSEMDKASGFTSTKKNTKKAGILAAMERREIAPDSSVVSTPVDSSMFTPDATSINIEQRHESARNHYAQATQTPQKLFSALNPTLTPSLKPTGYDPSIASQATQDNNNSPLVRQGNVIASVGKGLLSNYFNAVTTAYKPIGELAIKNGSNQRTLAEMQKWIDQYQREANDTSLPASKREASQKLADSIKQSMQTSAKNFATETPLEQVNYAAAPVEKNIDNLANSSNADMEKATQGKSGGAKTLLQGEKGGLQLGGNLVIGALTGTGVAPLAIDTFGSSAYDARKNGGSLGKQLAYGGLQAGTVALTGGLMSVGESAISKVIGSGPLKQAVADATNKAISKFIASDTGSAVASRLAATGETALSQGTIGTIQTALTPVFQRITYDPTAKLHASDLVHTALESAIIGSVFGAVGKKTVPEGKANAEAELKPKQESARAPVSLRPRFGESDNTLTSGFNNSSDKVNIIDDIQQQFNNFRQKQKVNRVKEAYNENAEQNSIDQNKTGDYNEGAGELSNITDGGNNAQFTYKNNPMENLKAGKDIVEDPKAVYGYSPNPLSERIGRFAEFDWTNKDVVARAREARLQYHKDNESMYNIVKGMQQNGSTVEEIARAANQQRNVNRLQSYIDTGNMSGYEKAVESNMRIFHNKFGMTADQAFAKYGSWDIVLEKAMSANAGMDACCGLYDDFYYLYSIGR